MVKNKPHFGHNTFLLLTILLVILENLTQLLRYGMITITSYSKHNMTMEWIHNVIMSLVRKQNVLNCTEIKQYIFSVHNKAFVVIIHNKNHQKEIF